MPSKSEDQKVGARLRVVVIPGVRIGAGKAALLEGIKHTGSISAAGRRIGMSYKRAWYLVEAMNSHFKAGPLVEATKGGRTGGGARLTALGEDVLSAVSRQSYCPGASPPAAQGWHMILSDIAMQKYR
jgi:molybdate transport system regulatory protein